MMDPNPKWAQKKIAFTGTNSSGKTTMALEVTARLKAEHHYLAEVVSSQDRKITWKDDHFPVNPQAHYGMICNLIHAEVAATLKGDANVVITDRSALDLYAIALTDHPDSSLVRSLGVMVRAWVETYTKIFYLPPLPYQEDGKRPPDEFRMRTHATLRGLIDGGEFPNVVLVEDRTTVMGQVRGVLGIPGRPVLAPAEKWQYVANVLGMSLAVKSPAWSSSDWDVWMLLPADGRVPEKNPRVVTTNVFGPLPIHIMGIPDTALKSLQAEHVVTIYTPEVQA